MDLLSLFVRIVFDRTDLDNGMDRTRQDADDFAKKIKKSMSGIVKGITGAVSAAATAIGGLVKKSVDAYGEYEQLRGGVETLFKNGADTVIKNAENAYKTAQISQKEYFQTVTSFSSSLIQGIAKSGKQMSAEELATRKKSLDSQYKLQKKAYDNEYEARQESISDEIELINKSNSKKLERIKEAHSQELEDYQKLTDNKIALIDKEYDEQLKIIDREAYERIKAIDDEINAIEAKEKAESEAAEKSAIAVQRAELEKEVRISNSAEARMKAQKALDAFDEEQAKKQAERDRANRKEALRSQKEEIKDEASERKNAAKAERDEKVNHVKEASQAELKAMRAAQKEQEESVQESMAEQLKIIQKAKNNELKALKEAQSDQLDALKESIEAQKDTLAEGMDELSTAPETYQKAAELADVAIIDMADNANKMGTAMGAIQAAYNGFSKQNYTMLDNLKLGYGGTKTEMERLIKDAAKLDSAVDANSMSFDNIVLAIHAVQTNLDIAGTSLDEAEKTIQGSTNTMKAAWQDLLDALSAKPEDDLPIGEAVQKFAESALTSYDILLQTVERALVGIGEMIDQMIPPLMDRLPEFVNEVLPKLVDAGAKMITSILTGISDNLPVIMKGAMSIISTLTKTIIENFPTLFKIGVNTLIELVRGITKELPQIIEACITIIDTIVNELTNEKTLNELLDVSLELLVTLVEGLTNSNAIPKLVEAGITIIKTVAKVLTSPENITKINNSAAKIVLGLAEGIVKSLPDHATAWLQIVFAIISGIQDTDWNEVGSNIVDGIWEGLKGSWSSVGNWLEDKWNGLVGQAKNILGIHSPSKVFKEIGGFTAEGFEEGWKSEFDEAQKTIESDLHFDVNHIQPASQNSVMPVMPNITLHIDKFVNNTDDDIEELADKLSEIMQQKTYRNEVIFA